MKIVFACLLTTLFCAVSSKEDPRSGIYAFTESGKGTRILRKDTGEEIVLTERLAANLGEPTMVSV